MLKGREWKDSWKDYDSEEPLMEKKTWSGGMTWKGRKQITPGGKTCQRESGDIVKNLRYFKSKVYRDDCKRELSSLISQEECNDEGNQGTLSN